jgi:glyoxylase I family protein
MPQLEDFYDRLDGWVAPGGTLLIMGHRQTHGPTHDDHGHGHGHGGREARLRDVVVHATRRRGAQCHETGPTAVTWEGCAAALVDMDIDAALAAVAVSDLDAATTFYERLFGRAADLEPMPGLAQWDVEPRGGLQVVADTERSGASMVTLLVADFDATLTALREAGIPTGEVIDGVLSRVTQVQDPAGNVITFAETPAARQKDDHAR